MGDAPSRQLLEALWAVGASVAAYDPKAAEEAERLYPEALADGRLILLVLAFMPLISRGLTGLSRVSEANMR